jgi:hypothetical protein
MINKLISLGTVILFLLMAATIFIQRKASLELKHYANLDSRKIAYLEYLLKVNWENKSGRLSGELKDAMSGKVTNWTNLDSIHGLIIYRQPVLGCTTCYEEKFHFFAKYSDSLKIRTILVTNETEQRNLANFMRISNYKGSIYFSNNVISELDLSSNIFIFLLENNQIKSIHIPDLEFPEYTRKFLESVSNLKK